MMRKETAGDYQIGIYSVRKVGRAWIASATGPGTIGTERHVFDTLGAAYLGLTGEPRNLDLSTPKYPGWRTMTAAQRRNAKYDRIWTEARARGDVA